MIGSSEKTLTVGCVLKLRVRMLLTGAAERRVISEKMELQDFQPPNLNFTYLHIMHQDERFGRQQLPKL